MKIIVCIIYVWCTCCICFLHGFLDTSQSTIKPTSELVYETKFVLTWELSMLYTDSDDVKWNVSLENGELFYSPNGTKIKLDQKDVNTLDGVQTNYIAINGQIPGPMLEVPLGATVYIHVENKLMTSSATIHWHGLSQRNTQWADGAAYITQCPILPGNSFTYKFIADEAGTFWYHSHLDMQRIDGLFGALIVKDKSLPIYPSFTVQIHDWLHKDSSHFATNLYGPPDTIAKYDAIPDRYDDLSDEDVGDLESDSFLVNGKGRFQGNSAPLTVHKVNANQQYMFRFINTGFDNLLEVSIDSHTMTVVGVDSCEVEPRIVDSVFLAVGERVNVLVSTDQPPENYWVRYRAPHKHQTPLGYSVFSYKSSDDDPTSLPKACSDQNRCIALNCPFQSAPGWSCIPIHELKSTNYHTTEVSKIQRGDNLSEHFVAYSYMVGDSINGRTFVYPSSPFYQLPYSQAGIPCDSKVCDREGCACTNVRTVPSNRVVQIVIMHHVLKHFIHTWHMHGYRFAVLRVVYPPRDSSGLILTTLNRDIACSNDLCNDARWINSSSLSANFVVDKPPFKDTLMIPVGGYAVVRIYSDNPGYWMAHCHQSEHLHEGMAMVFDIDSDRAKPNVPAGFPTCGNFRLDPAT